MKKFLSYMALVLGLVIHAWPVAAAVTSTQADQTKVSVAVYNQNLAYVSETRSVSLQKGTAELQLGDVPRYIHPDTITLTSLKGADSLKVLEQNHIADLMQESRLLDAYVGKQVKIMRWNEYQDRHDIVNATLLSNHGSKIFEINGEIYIGHPGTIILPEVPENFVSTPTLRFLYASPSSGMQDLDISYLTGGLSWTANYQLILDEKMTEGQLTSWVTLTNTSEAEFKDAHLRIIAGDLNQAPPAYKSAPPVMAMSRAMADMAEAAPARNFQQSGVSDYYQFELNQPVTLKNYETKQIQLFTADISRIERVYRVGQGQPLYLTYRNPQEQDLPVSTMVRFKNETGIGLGRPLPQGKVRFFSDNREKQRTYLGADSVAHTPEGEEIEWVVGTAFDLKAERKQTDYREITRHVRETEFELTLKNQKDEDVTFEVRENLNGDWTILNASHAYEKIDANTVEFRITVGAKQEVTVNYRVSTGR